MANIIERLRSTHHHTIGSGVPELCEEAAREIERLKEAVNLYQQASEYLAGKPISLSWDNDV
jgi:hypothetical protein